MTENAYIFKIGKRGVDRKNALVVARDRDEAMKKLSEGELTYIDEFSTIIVDSPSGPSVVITDKQHDLTQD